MADSEYHTDGLAEDSESDQDHDASAKSVDRDSPFHRVHSSSIRVSFRYSHVELDQTHLKARTHVPANIAEPKAFVSSNRIGLEKVD